MGVITIFLVASFLNDIFNSTTILFLCLPVLLDMQNLFLLRTNG